MIRRLTIALLFAAASCSNCDDDGGGLVCTNGEVEQDGQCVPGSNTTNNTNNNSVNDDDNDGVPNADDNCPQTPNPDQADADGDGVGDVCDDCANVANADQNGCPDEWDAGRDGDGDGVPDISDNCPDVANADQADTDGDGIGDACDGCPGLENQFIDDVCADNALNPMINTVAPSIYMLVDASGSMANQLDQNRPRPWPIDEFQAAITMLPDALLAESRVGVGQYPFQPPPDPAATCTYEHLLDIAPGQAMEVRDAANAIEPFGDTPTGYALQQVLEQGILDDPTDPLNDSRPKAVVLVTDGDPTVACDSGTPINSRAMAQPEAVAGAQALADDGVPVFVVGFQSGADPARLDEIAAAGGTDAPDPTRRHFVAGNSAELVTALQSIRDETAICRFEVMNTTPQVDELLVDVEGSPVAEDPQNGYTYDAGVLTLNGAACDSLGADPTTAINVKLVDRGTSPICQTSGAELCDYVDNDCNGQVDEVCPAPSEVCDGVDNDLDGQTDEGCP